MNSYTVIKRVYWLFLSSIVPCTTSCAQSRLQSSTNNRLPTVEDVTRVESFLASDSLKGRKTFSPEIETASSFVEKEFKAAGLKPYTGRSFRQEFFLYTFKPGSASLEWDGIKLGDTSYCISGGGPEMNFTSLKSFTVDKIRAGDKPGQILGKYLGKGPLSENVLVLVDPSFQRLFTRLKSYPNANLESSSGALIFVIATKLPLKFTLHAHNTILKQALNNVAGILPGHGRPNEFVVFSAHYDHLGTGRSPSAMRQPENGKDSIFNGANDDASGTTAVIELAHYFGKKSDNGRSLLFVAFTAEEIGEYGSRYFALTSPNEKIAAMFNIEMIGTPSKWGKDSGYITGYERSDFGKILNQNLSATQFKFYPDPYTSENLFYRSDNAQLARKGVPAHTLSTSKMDDEHNYHTPQDEVSTLDLGNMTRIIDAVAIGSRSIVSGKDTPSRIAPENR